MNPADNEEKTTKVDSKEFPPFITSQFVTGNFEPGDHEDFVLIDPIYADREGLFLHKRTYDSFKLMWDAAQRDGIKLIIKSATRNFEYQKGIWERKWSGQTSLSDGSTASEILGKTNRALKILKYSSMPGTSRHHWGTDLDLNSFNNSYFTYGEGLKIYNWLTTNAENFGFCQPYTTKDNGRSGYEEEKWHWTYIPLSRDITNYYSSHISNKEITGFLGSEVATEVDMINNFVLGIDQKCL